MMIDDDKYESDVSKWFDELKDIVAVDLLWQHINKYPEKKDYEIKEQDENTSSDDNEQTKIDK